MGFPWPQSAQSCPCSCGVSWGRKLQSRETPQSAGVPSHPWECLQQPLAGGDSPEPHKAFGTQFSSLVPPIDGKAENQERQLGK